MPSIQKTIVQVNVYFVRSVGRYAYRADDHDGYDSSEMLDSDREHEAIQEVKAMFPIAQIAIVSAIN